MKKHLLIFPILMLLLVINVSGSMTFCPGYMAGEYCIIGIEEEMKWKDARSYCNNLYLGGHTWRLASLDDFYYIFNECEEVNCAQWLYDTYDTIENYTQDYDGILAEDYWTSTTYSSWVDMWMWRYAYTVDLGDNLNVDDVATSGGLSTIFGVVPERYGICVSSDYFYFVYGEYIEYDKTSIPDWFPDPPDENKTFWVIIVIIAIIVMVSFSDASHFLAHALFGIVSIIGVLVIATFIGWLAWWIMLIIIALIIGTIILLKGHGGNK